VTQPDKQPAGLVHRDSDLVAFTSNAPVNPGHMRVVPREHAPSLADLAPDLAT
jgi:diadenosine tetraphosphate (Ap4A) HIT family hydrolase